MAVQPNNQNGLDGAAALVAIAAIRPSETKCLWRRNNIVSTQIGTLVKPVRVLMLTPACAKRAGHSRAHRIGNCTSQSVAQGMSS